MVNTDLDCVFEDRITARSVDAVSGAWPPPARTDDPDDWRNAVRILSGELAPNELAAVTGPPGEVMLVTGLATFRLTLTGAIGLAEHVLHAAGCASRNIGR